MTRTPYGIAGSGGALEAKGSYAELAREQYIFVYQDIRGRYGSGGRVHHEPSPARRRRPERRRREHRHLRHHHLAAGQHLAQQRLGWRAGHLLSGLARRHGRHPSASGREGDLAPGADDRHLDGRRFLPLWRVPAELRLRVLHRARAFQGRVGAAAGELLRHLQLVPRAGTAQQPDGAARRPRSHLDQLHRAPVVRRLLEEPRPHHLAHRGGRAHAGGRRLVGPGGLLRCSDHLRDAGASSTATTGTTW